MLECRMLVPLNRAPVQSLGATRRFLVFQGQSLSIQPFAHTLHKPTCRNLLHLFSFQLLAHTCENDSGCRHPFDLRPQQDNSNHCHTSENKALQTLCLPHFRENAGYSPAGCRFPGLRCLATARVCTARRPRKHSHPDYSTHSPLPHLRAMLRADS